MVNVVSSIDPEPEVKLLVLGGVEPLPEFEEQPLPVHEVAGVSVVGVGVSVTVGEGVVDTGAGVDNPEALEVLPSTELPDVDVEPLVLVDPLPDTDVQPLPVQEDDGVSVVGSGVVVADTGAGVSVGVGDGTSVATSHLLRTNVGVGVGASVATSHLLLPLELALVLPLLDPVSPQNRF